MTISTPTKASHALAEWLRSRKLSQAALGHMLSAHLGRPVPQATISRTVNGTSMPRGPLMAALLRVCGIRIEWWVTPPPKEDPSSSTTSPGERSQAA